MTLVGAQLALSTLLLIACALLGKTVDSALQMDLSQVSGALIIGSVETLDPDFRAPASARLRGTAAISVAGWIVTPPLARPVRRDFVIAHGNVSESVEFDVNFASSGYFSAMRYPILEGRGFKTADDLGRTDVVIVNEALAERYFANGALGHTLVDSTGQTAEIVGVVRTRSYRALEGALRPMVYYPMGRAITRVFYAVVRGKSYARTAEEGVRAALQAGQPRHLDVETFEAHVARALATDRLIVTLVGASGVVALLLAVAGVYGVMMDTVQRRRREIALRIALGAGSVRIVRTVTAAVLAPAFSGMAAGVVAALIASRIGRAFVYGVPSLEPGVLAAIVSGLAVLVAAAVAPSIARALRVSPLAALRD
jgi:ABC-type antimicrobial peptide transport system permease subunit